MIQYSTGKLFLMMMMMMMIMMVEREGGMPRPVRMRGGAGCMREAELRRPAPPWAPRGCSQSSAHRGPRIHPPTLAK